MNAQDIIARSMRLLGSLGEGTSPSAAEAQDGLTALNGMLDAWKVHRMSILSTTRSTYALTSGTASYTIGPAVVSPNFTQVRPAYISGVGILLTDSSTIETPLEPYTEEEWRDEAIKTQSGTPTRYRWVRGAPNGTLTFWPVPDAADTVAIYWPAPLGRFADLTTDYDLAEGLEEALPYNLAVRLAPEFGKPLTQIVADMAASSLATVKRSNKELLDMAVDPALLGGGAWSIYTGDFR